MTTWRERAEASGYLKPIPEEGRAQAQRSNVLMGSREGVRIAESELDNIGVGIARVGRDVEAELPAHGEHRGVLAQHLAFNDLEAFGTGVFDDQLHEQVAEAASLEIGAYEDGILTAVVVCVGMQADHTEHVARRFLDRDEGHGARIIDLGEARDEAVAELLDRREEAQTQIVAA